MGKYVALAIVALGLAACQSDAPYRSAAAGGTAATGTHDVRVNFDTGVTRDVATDYDLRKGDRVIMLSNGKVGPL